MHRCVQLYIFIKLPPICVYNFIQVVFIVSNGIQIRRVIQTPALQAVEIQSSKDLIVAPSHLYK